MYKFFRICLLSFLFVSTSGWATHAHNNVDPFERSNRVIYTINTKLDKAILRPTALCYQKAFPWLIRQGVGNFYRNLSEIPVFFNQLLQKHYHEASDTAGRFVVNSSLGIGGLFDVAVQRGVPYHYTDFGMTLAHWGTTQSTYLVLPLFGPSTIRDTIGAGVDTLMNPKTYISHTPTSLGVTALYAVHIRTEFLNADPIMEEATLDGYVFQRDAYLQHRHYLMHDSHDADNVDDNDPYIEDDIDDSIDMVLVDPDVDYEDNEASSQ